MIAYWEGSLRISSCHKFGDVMSAFTHCKVAQTHLRRRSQKKGMMHRAQAMAPSADVNQGFSNV